MADELEGLKFFIRTFGCQMNENDSGHLAGMLMRAGARPASSPEDSDIILINTCAVREKSEEKIYSYLGRLAPLKMRTGRLIGLAGCVAQLRRGELLRKCPAADFVIGPDNYFRLVDVLLAARTEKILKTEWHADWHEFPAMDTARESPVTAYVTIMEGCNNFCAYCVVPYARGREKFRPSRNILQEIEDLAGRGYKEIQLLGQNVNSYRDPVSGEPFSALLGRVARTPGIEWIRFITSHPKDLGDDIIAAMAENRNICRQLHLPFQSGSSAVLARMNRGYTREIYLDIVDRLRDKMPGIGLSTDIIVGFPGETEADFEETLDLVQRVRFVNVFSFRYSPRPGTAAARIPDDVPLAVKSRRLIALQGLQKKIQLENNKTMIGKTEKILALGSSKKDKLVHTGRNEAFQVVNFRCPGDPTGKFLDVRITDCGPYSLFGECPA